MVNRWVFISSLVMVLAMLVPSAVSYAQIEQGGPTLLAPRGSTTNFHFAEPNELTIVVSVLGAVKNPGRYEISRSIDLLNLLAVAGGTLDNADLGDVRIYRNIDVIGKVERREFRLDLSDLTRFQAEPFAMQQGDFVSIGRSSGVTFQEVVSYLSTAAVLTVAVATIIEVTGPGRH